MRSKTSARGRPQAISDDDLVDAARAVFLADGVGATTAEIARKARVSESVIFHRYKTKEALFMAVLDRERRVAPFLELLSERVGKGDVAATLFDLGMSVIDVGRAVMPFMLIASMMARASKWKLAALREQLTKPRPEVKRSIQLLANYIDAEAERGRLRKLENSESIAMMFFSSLMQHLMQQHWWGGEFSTLDTPAFVRMYVDLFLNGMGPRRPPKAS